ncbi:MAG: hypothetical protein JO265_07175 [Acidimicrobiia bacterium]|nr:hypothetical protein [Acidimicrobiia bacterium]
MTADDVRAVGRLGVRAFTGAVTHVERVHSAIATRAFQPASVAGAPARYAHDAISRAVYASVRTAGKGAGRAGAELTALLAAGAATQRQPHPRTSSSANLASSILNAVLGDRLAARHDPLAIRMAIRAAGRDVPVEGNSLAEAFPAASSGVAVFVHGLAENEQSWRRRVDEWGTTYGDRLDEEFGFTPVYVRYNSGRHISDNGQDLGRLLGDLVREWPVAVDRIILVGHSMGGLVARSACHYGVTAGDRWTALVTDVFYLGSPHTGAALERLAGRLGWALGHLAETRPYADLVNVRSAGIKDLRHGYVVEEDWRGCDADRCLHDHRHDVELLAHANHHAFSAALSANPRGPSARLLGDLLVQPASARGRHRRHRPIPFPADRDRHFGGLHHFDLLNHPAVYEAMRASLGARPPTED